MNGKNILLGVSGGVGAFKACELLRLFLKAGSGVRVIMTESATKFVTPLSFQSLGAEAVSYDMFAEKRDTLEHVSWADWGEILVIAPATANIIGKLANGIADEALSTQAIAFDGNILLAPAMNVKMYNNKTVRKNIEYLNSIGVNFIGPETGQLASMITAAGRMSEPELVFKRTRQLLLNRSSLRGKKVIVTAGPTVEPIDPVRSISNYSSGKMGYALADAAAGFGADVNLISGPVHLDVPPSVKIINVKTAEEMLSAVRKECAGADLLYMAAAVADYRPSVFHRQKIKREKDSMRLDLRANPDILKSLGRNRPKVAIGFALETENIKARAIEKLKEKNLDFIVANNPTEKGVGFGSDFNKVALYGKKGFNLILEKAEKFDIAVKIIEESIKLLNKRGSKRKKQN
ncbi:MAG: bifunctional phosphopantothenoylcysteine decarboxylase/phosphopantothenate--cysteine ligase CoaBC [Candidatus Zixiibacteriota bacterium]|nr:MAG: bifunctional phosphopantothenoylcysteine decarboxylase/phosphopantothenate--cysteine ligase CoaBC [candidate division Zixibacteria bacterium]